MSTVRNQHRPTPTPALALSTRAATLAERLAVAATSGAPVVPPPGGARLELWMAEVAGGREALLQKRLTWDGLPFPPSPAVLADDLPGTAPGPWLDFFLAMSSTPPACTTLAAGALADTSIPFGQAFLPFVATALHLAGDEAAASGGRVGDAILPSLACALGCELSRLAAPVLAADYEAHGGTGRAEFVRRLEDPAGWTETLVRFPALARLLATLCLGWAAETREFLGRLNADWNRLRDHFFPGAANDATLTAVEGGLSDRHAGAGMVKILRFSDGGRLVYKRRPLALEADFHEFLRDLAAAGLTCAPPALRVLACDGYGWVGHASAAPVQDAAALTAWFEKAGSLLCLMQLLGGNDGHMENIIATADGPVMIDLETLLQPRLGSADPARGGTFALAARQVQDSVLQTGLLPLWQKGRQGRLYDIGGLTGEGGYESPVLRLVWENTGTDAIRPVWRTMVASPLDNLPALDGIRHPAGRHLQSLCAGFAATWRFLASHRDLLSTTLAKWAEAPLRVLLRPTSHYAALLERSLGGDNLKNGVDRSLIFEALRRPFLQNHEERPALWAAVAEEIAALEAGDIPLFYVRAGERDLLSHAGDVVVPAAFAQSALDSAGTRLGTLDEPRLARQLEMIAGAFIETGSTLSAPASQANEPEVDYQALLKMTTLVSDEGLLTAANFLGNQIKGAALRGRDGFVTWLAPGATQPDRQDQRGVSYYLYDGAAGMSLFLAALASVTGDAAARETALAALGPVKAILSSRTAAEMIKREGVGGCSGLGSLVYSLAVISSLLHEPGLLDQAVQLSAFIDAPRIAADQSLDIVSGSAGAIHALLALHRLTEDAAVLDRARACGHHLLEKAVRAGDGGLAWPSWPDRLLLAGYSHGTAGIASALLALGRATGSEKFTTAARAALQYERGLFDPIAGNWPMLLAGGDSRCVSTWCHGAPGILLSRLGFLGQFGKEEDALLRDELATAARTTLRAGLSQVDHLCCGTMGRVEILHAASRTLGGRTLEIARLGATLTLQRARQRKAFSLQTDPVRNAVFQPGFFRGTSGIGYSLLRLAHPDTLPSIFTWQV